MSIILLKESLTSPISSRRLIFALTVSIPSAPCLISLLSSVKGFVIEDENQDPAINTNMKQNRLANNKEMISCLTGSLKNLIGISTSTVQSLRSALFKKNIRYFVPKRV